MSENADDIAMLLHPPPPPQLGPFLDINTEFVLCEEGAEDHSASAEEEDERVRAILAFLSDPEKARRCAETRIIETPEYSSASEPSMMSKTRGASAPVDDTSDAVYEQLHAKHERAEKRLRKLEKEALVRDRRRALERLRRIEKVDVEKLLPAIEAREEEVAKSKSEPQRTREELLANVTQAHANMLADARAIVDRYNKLLPDEAQQDSAGGGSRSRSRSRSQGAHASPLPSSPPVPRMRRIRLRSSAPTLADVARKTKDTPHIVTDMTCESGRAFGEHIPGYAERAEPFDDTMAAWLHTFFAGGQAPEMTSPP